MSVPLDRCTHLVDHLMARADQTPDAPALTFLEQGERPTEQLSYAALDHRARVIAAALQARGAQGQRVLLFYPTGVEFISAFLGCLYAGSVAVPTSPPLPGRAPARLLSVHRDSTPTVALCSDSLLEPLQGILANSPVATQCLATDALGPSLASEWRPSDLNADSLAFLQYTSGSTSAPKGVMVSHGNLLENTKVIQTAFEQPDACTIVSWLPLFHDMGLIGTALDALTMGAHCVLMDPQSFIMKPVRWLRAISNYKAHTSGGPDFGYQLCTRKITDGQLEGIDLSGWRVAFNGSERVRPATAREFAARFAGVGVTPETMYPCYGLAESTLFASGGQATEPTVVNSFDAAALEAGLAQPAGGETKRRIDLVSCGIGWRGHSIEIVDPEEQEFLPQGRVGELWLAGRSIAKGYFNRPDETQETFQASTGSGRGPFLRTGDLGFVLDGQVYLTGRLKDLIIIAGRNHHPEDIEQTVEACHPVIREGGLAAFGVERSGDECLCVVAELAAKNLRRLAQDGLSQSEIRNEIMMAAREAVAAQHGVRLDVLQLVRAGTVPKTTSGKVQRGRCKAAHLLGEYDSVEFPA